MSWESILGKVVATALLGLEEATQAISSPVSIPTDISTFVSGVIGIWTTAAQSESAAPAVAAAYKAYVAKKAA